MAHIKPFKAVRPTKETAKRVAALPYDVVEIEEAKEIIKENPDSFLKVDLAESDFDKLPKDLSPEIYQKAQENYLKLKESGKLTNDKDLAFYIYELTNDSHTQAGIVGLLDSQDYLNGKLKQHEFTRKLKEDDRVEHIKKLKAHTGPIYLAYQNNKKLDELIKKTQETKPLFEFISDDKIKHRIFKIINQEEINTIIAEFEKLDNLYIADGHHRARAATRVYQELKTPESQYFVSVIFPKESLEILAYNRIIKDLNGLNKEEFLEKLKKAFKITKKDEPVIPRKKHHFGMFLDNEWFELIYQKPISGNSIDSLDVSILSNEVLEPILGITDIRKDERINFSGGPDSINELIDLTGEGVSFSLFPTEMDDLIINANNDKIMPPKSTWFEPKLYSGLFIHEFS